MASVGRPVSEIGSQMTRKLLFDPESGKVRGAQGVSGAGVDTWLDDARNIYQYQSGQNQRVPVHRNLLQLEANSADIRLQTA